MEIAHDELIWLAGILEGEGSFMKGPPSQPNTCCVSVQMTDEDVIAKIAELVESKYFQPKKQKSHHKQSYKLYIRGDRAVELMAALRPYMFSRRQNQIDQAIASYKSTGPARKIPKEKEEEILSRFLSGARAKDLANEYGVSHWAIYRMKERMGH